MADGPESLTISDRALLHALRGWGGPVDPRAWDLFRKDWRDALLAGWIAMPRVSPEQARESLRLEHAAEARPDLDRVHESWCLRALREESPAVRRAVIPLAPPALRESLREGLGLGTEDLATDRSPLPDALQGALALWTERIVGDIASRGDDPPVIVALSAFAPGDLSRLILASALVKWSLAEEEPPRLRPRDRAWFEGIRNTPSPPSPRIRQLAKYDVARLGRSERDPEEMLGLLTFARLLEVVEPYRVRWALQHLPYHVARSVRGLMNPRPDRRSSLADWESEVFRIAWEQLRSEGRIGLEFGAAP